MAVPILTIPEAAYDPHAYTQSSRGRQLRLLRFLLSLTRTSAAALVLAYAIGYLALKPLLQSTTEQRLDFLEACRGRLRDLYLNVIGRVEYIPSIRVNRSANETRIYSDAVCQTVDIQQTADNRGAADRSGYQALLRKLHTLSDRLQECSGFVLTEMEHFRVVDFSLKDLRQKTDMVYFDQSKLFVRDATAQPHVRQINMAQDVRQKIRGIKGMFMSGQA